MIGAGPRVRRRLTASAGLVSALTALLVAAPAFAAGPALADPGGTPARAATSTGPDPLILTLLKVSPAAVGPNTPLVVSATVRNSSAAAITKVKVRLRLHAGALTTRSSIDDWLTAGTVADSDTVLPGAAKLHTLQPGASRSFTITVARGKIGLSALNSFGPRGITLEAQGGGDRGGLLRTTVVWSPPGARPARTRLSLLVPFTGTYSENAGAPTTAVADSFENGGRMLRLQQAASDPAVGWALDPAVLESAQRLIRSGEVSSADDDPLSATPSPSASSRSKNGSTPNTTDAVAIGAATTWLNTVKDDRGTHAVLALPYADPDLTSMFRSTKGLTLLRAADRLGAAAIRSTLGGSLDATVAWPGDGQITPSGTTALARAGRTAIVLSADSQPPTPPVSYTPTGRSTVRNDSSDLSGLLYDDQLSALFAAGGALDSAGSSATSDATSPAAAGQTLLAQLAAISLQLPSQSRQVLAVAPRTWDPDPTAVKSLLSELHDCDWVSLRSLDTLRATTSTTPRAEPTYHKLPTGSELPIGNTSGATAMLRDLDTLAPALSDSDAVVGPLQEQVVSLLSFSWRGDKDGLSQARSDVRDDVEQLVGGVRLLIGTKKKLFTARTASIPIFVDNNTNFPMHLLVQLIPGSGQLAITGKVPVYAAAQARTQVLVPARAIANGDVLVEGKLLTTKGKQLGPTESFTLRARPNWETRGTIGAVAVLGLLLVFGLLRGIGRGRTRIPPHSVPDVDDQASGRMLPAPDQISQAPADDVAEAAEPSGDTPDGQATGPATRDLLNQGSARPISRAEQRPRAARQTPPATVPAPSVPGAETGTSDALRPVTTQENR